MKRTESLSNERASSEQKISLGTFFHIILNYSLIQCVCVPGDNEVCVCEDEDGVEIVCPYVQASVSMTAQLHYESERATLGQHTHTHTHAAGSIQRSSCAVIHFHRVHHYFNFNTFFN